MSGKKRTALIAVVAALAITAAIGACVSIVMPELIDKPETAGKGPAQDLGGSGTEPDRAVTQESPVTAAELIGFWQMFYFPPAEGSDSYRFEPDGTFAFDYSDSVDPAELGYGGTWRLSGGRLHLRVTYKVVPAEDGGAEELKVPISPPRTETLEIGPIGTYVYSEEYTFETIEIGKRRYERLAQGESAGGK